MKQIKHHRTWLAGLLAILLIGILGFARGHVRADPPATVGTVTANQVLTVYNGVGGIADPTGETLQPGDKADVTNIFMVDGQTWLALAGTNNHWVSLDPAYNPKYESRLWTRTPVTVYQGFGSTRVRTTDTIVANGSRTVTASVDWNGIPWYQVGKDQWATTAAGFNPAPTGQTLTTSFVTTIYTRPDAQRQATGKTLAAMTTVPYNQTQVVDGNTWYAIGDDQWITTAPVYNPGFTQYVYVPNTIPVWTTYATTRQKTAKTATAGSSWLILETTWADGIKWYEIGPDQWITLDDAINNADVPVPPTPVPAKHIVTLTAPTKIYIGANGTATAKTLAAGTRWQFYRTLTVNGATWYSLGANRWITNGQDTTGWRQQPKTDPIRFPILMYHELGSDPTSTWYVPINEFASQMAWLRENGYYFLNTQEAYTVLTTNQAPSDKLVWLTMDDGYASWFKDGLPVIQQYGVKGTMFLITNSSTLTTQQAAIMKDNGMDIQAHTLNHFHLSALPDYQQKQEMAGSKAYLDSTFHQNTTAIAYPYGDYNEETEKLAADIGFTLGLRMHDGLASADNGLYSLNRIKVSPGLDQAGFEHLVEHGWPAAGNDDNSGPSVLR
ncbi:polysaccharide deacetylase family protein [Schleiferilactobacillus shenzhenensis]|uniref:YxkH n=1 Tax=Schleiferilactobacillus shenzhenensis LY-73 TaxID=1231336 RepID=U4TS02_9LACO|nr:polysaccharide deacetylase family protein [Schleiferilactobacillus shenzhenensis]ERL64678.1 YxkH [Schleiferilactobacillus shenzhenensis LY-73]